MYLIDGIHAESNEITSILLRHRGYTQFFKTDMTSLWPEFSSHVLIDIYYWQRPNVEFGPFLRVHPFRFDAHRVIMDALLIDRNGEYLWIDPPIARDPYHEIRSHIHERFAPIRRLRSPTEVLEFERSASFDVGPDPDGLGTRTPSHWIIGTLANEVPPFPGSTVILSKSNNRLGPPFLNTPKLWLSIDPRHHRVSCGIQELEKRWDGLRGVRNSGKGPTVLCMDDMSHAAALAAQASEPKMLVQRVDNLQSLRVSLMTSSQPQIGVRKS